MSVKDVARGEQSPPADCAGAQDRKLKGHKTAADLVGHWGQGRIFISRDLTEDGLPDFFQVKVYSPASGGWHSFALHVSQISVDV